MSISGLVVHARPENVDAVRAAIVAMEGTDIHGESDEGKFVVTVDLENDREASDTMGRLLDLEGVLTTTLVYNYFDNTSDQDPAEKEEAQ